MMETDTMNASKDRTGGVVPATRLLVMACCLGTLASPRPPLAYAEHVPCDLPDLGDASCGRPARGKSAVKGCTAAGIDVVLDKCYIHSFTIDGEDKRVVVFYTATNLVCATIGV